MPKKKPLQPMVKRSLLINDDDWQYLKEVAQSELGISGGHSQGIRMLIREHRKRESGAYTNGL